MNNIEITQFNTIKGTKYGEISVNKFIKMIKKNIDKYTNNDNTKGSNICYKSKVYKVDKDKYQVSILSTPSIFERLADDEGVLSKSHYNNYMISTKDNLDLAKQLDEFSDITSQHSFEKQCYHEIVECDKKTNDVNAIKACLSYLQKNYKHLNRILTHKILLMLMTLPLIVAVPVIDIYFGGTASFVAFFPCTYFSDQSQLVSRGDSFGMKDFSDEEKINRSMIDKTN